MIALAAWVSVIILVQNAESKRQTYDRIISEPVVL